VRTQQEKQRDKPNDDATWEPLNQVQRRHTGYDDHNDLED